VTGCIESTRTPSQRYPQRWWKGRPQQESHIVWEEANDPVPPGFYDPEVVSLDAGEGHIEVTIRRHLIEGGSPTWRSSGTAR
jgi:hypothetical protein